jgi:nucleoside-diphosphate-sugar epimerase
MNILLTGASGFVGRVLYRKLLELNYNLTCVFRERWRKDIVESEFADCTPFFSDDMDGKTIWSICLKNIDQVVHLAALAHVVTRADADLHQRFLAVNHEATKNLAVQAARQGVKRFVFISSITVNGNANISGPFCETHPLHPCTSYAIAKFEAEKTLRCISAESGMDVVILRPPLVYGPHVKANFLKLLHFVCHGIPLPFGAVHNKRSFMGIKNLVDAICLCISHEKAGNQTFMVSDCQDLSTRQLIEKIAAAMGRRPRLFPLPENLMKTIFSIAGQHNIYERLWGSLQADTSKIQKCLGWKPKVTVEQGIQETVNWYLTNHCRHITTVLKGTG